MEKEMQDNRMDTTPAVQNILNMLANTMKLPELEEGMAKANEIFEICNNLIKEVMANNPTLTWEGNRSEIISLASKLAEERFADRGIEQGGMNIEEK